MDILLKQFEQILHEKPWLLVKAIERQMWVRHKCESYSESELSFLQILPRKWKVTSLPLWRCIISQRSLAGQLSWSCPPREVLRLLPSLRSSLTTPPLSTSTTQSSTPAAPAPVKQRRRRCSSAQRAKANARAAQHQAAQAEPKRQTSCYRKSSFSSSSAATSTSATCDTPFGDSCGKDNKSKTIVLSSGWSSRDFRLWIRVARARQKIEWSDGGSVRSMWYLWRPPPRSDWRLLLPVPRQKWLLPDHKAHL